MEKFRKGQWVHMRHPIGARGSLTRRGTVVDVVAGLVLVWTQDNLTHLFEASDGTLAHSPELGPQWKLVP